MIKLLCPNCMKSVSVADEAAGTEAPCPDCGKPFAVPARYYPLVAEPPPPPMLPAPPAPPVTPEPTMSPAPTDRPTPPPGLVPPVYPSPSPHLEPFSPPPLPPGYTHSWGLNFSLRWVVWVPAVALSLILVLTFFNWVGSYAGDSPAYAQNAWRSLVGSVYRNQELEKVMKDDAALPSAVLEGTRADWMMLLYLLALLLAVVVAWAERTVVKLDVARLPRQLHWLGPVWPHRVAIVAGLTTFALLVLFIQTTSGFGLERAIERVVSEEFAKKREEAGTDQNKLKDLRTQEQTKIKAFNVERTIWLHLAIVLNILVVAAMLTRSWLERRGTKPPPRIVFQC